jgi:hypothetical protein
MVNESQIIKEEYILSITQKTKFAPNGVKIIDENAEPLVLLRTSSQRMFFSASVAQSLMKDIALLLAGIKKEVPKPEVKEEKIPKK